VEKAPDAFRTISEVAEEIDVPQHVLRFWESRFPQIRPMKRGGGRRYYRPDDVDLLRGVRHLLYGEGYTIRGVQRILREQGVSFVQSVWSKSTDDLPADVEAEDAEEGGEIAAARAEPNLFAVGSPKTAPGAGELQERREPAIVASPTLQGPSLAQASGPVAERAARADLTEDERAKLRMALGELLACRGILETSLQER
jgi:DNA-binding transcriptional MerR regulator